MIIPSIGKVSRDEAYCDAFTQEPLALLDAELIKQGQAIPIGTLNVVTR